MIDRLLGWLNGESNLISNPSQSDLSILVSLLLLSISPPSFLCSDLFLFNKAKSISYFNINDCSVLSIYWSMDSQMGIITYKYQSIRTIPLCHYQIQSSWLFEAISLLSILNKSYFKLSFGYDWQIGIVVICECTICDRWVIGNNNDNNDRNEWLIDWNNNPNSVSLKMARKTT